MGCTRLIGYRELGGFGTLFIHVRAPLYNTFSHFSSDNTLIIIKSIETYFWKRRSIFNKHAEEHESIRLL